MRGGETQEMEAREGTGKKRDIEASVGEKINIPDISRLRRHGMSQETTPGLRNAAALFSQILKGSHSRRP